MRHATTLCRHRARMHLLLSLLLVTTVTALFPTEAPVQAGANPDCIFWGVATTGATCDGIVNGLGIQLEAFFSMNPQLNRDCPQSQKTDNTNERRKTLLCAAALDAHFEAPSGTDMKVLFLP